MIPNLAELLGRSLYALKQLDLCSFRLFTICSSGHFIP